MEVRLIDKGITVAEDYIAGTVYVEYDNTDSILPFKNRVIDWWRKADDNYEAIEIYEIKDRHKWIETKVGNMENLIKEHLRINEKPTRNII